MVRSLDESIHTAKVNIDEAEVDLSNLLKNLVEFNNKSRPSTIEGKEKKDTFESAYALDEGPEFILKSFKSGTFPVKATKGEGLKILNLKQIPQRLPIVLAQVKAGNTFENLLHEIR